MLSFRRKKDRLRHFVGDGVWASVCEGFAEANFNALSIVLLATPSQIGILSSVQNLIGCWFQLWSGYLVQLLQSQKKLVLICVGLQVVTLFSMMVSIAIGISPFTFMGLTLVFTTVGGLSGPVWNSWISQLLPEKRRGLCFGIRNQRTYPAHFISVLVGGVVLQNLELSFHKENTGTQIAFTSIFMIGLIAKVLSFRHLLLQPEPPLFLPEKPQGPLELFKITHRDIELRKTLIFFGTMGFAINLSGPFQTPYLLETLHLNYLQFASITAAYLASRFLAAPTLGRIVDSIGSKQVLLISSLLMPLISLGWYFSKTYASLLVVQFIAGAIWAAFDLCAFTFLAESTHSQDRQLAYSAKHIAWTLASSAGAMTGGILLHSVAQTQIVFWASFFARLIPAFLVLRIADPALYQEPQSKEEIQATQDAA